MEPRIIKAGEKALMSSGSAQRAREALVLVVDDQKEIRELATLALQDAGYTVHSVEHGRAALEAVRNEAISVILLDMHMPVMDGWQFVRAYRSIPTLHVPLVVMTAAHDARQY